MKKVINYLLLALIVLLSIITVFPFIYMILTGLMTYAEATSIPPTLIPKSLQFQNYWKYSKERHSCVTLPTHYLYHYLQLLQQSLLHY